MILYLHGFDATSSGNHEKMRQLQFIDDDIRLISYSTLHPKNDMQYILNDVAKQVRLSEDSSPLIIGVGLGGYWAERVGFLCGLKSVMINPNLHPEHNMQGKIDRPEEYQDIASKCVSGFRNKNKMRALCILSRTDEVLDSKQAAQELAQYYSIIWDEHQQHKFKSLSAHLTDINIFKQQVI
ncbi:MAG: alpha/beta hydrolase YcfP [Parashewanella sp.]